MKGKKEGKEKKEDLWEARKTMESIFFSSEHREELKKERDELKRRLKEIMGIQANW